MKCSAALNYIILSSGVLSVANAFSDAPIIRVYRHDHHNLISDRRRRNNGNINHQLQLHTAIKATSSTSESTNPAFLQTTVSTREELQKMTVKQLKSYIDMHSIPIPKDISVSKHLKLKKDVVEFIWNHISTTTLNSNGVNGEPYNNAEINNGLNGQQQVNGNTSADSIVEGESAAISKKKRMNNQSVMGRTGMPPLPTIPDDDEGEVNKDAAKSSPYVLTPKDRIVLDVLNRYPPLHESIINACSLNDNLPIEEITTSNIEHCNLSSINYAVPTGIGEEDIRHTYHPMVSNITQSDLDLVFIGTASCTPGVTRGVSCTAIRVNWRSSRSRNDGDGLNDKQKKSKKQKEEYSSPTTGGTWLFDCGESTQLSIQRTTSIKPGKISKIFITHCHGDHSFGLPGLLCLMGTDRNKSDPPIEIYGPEGLRMWLRVAIRYSVSRVVPNYRVHELLDVPMAPEWEEGHRKNGRFYYQINKANVNRKRGWGMQGLAGEDPVSWISRAPMINLEVSYILCALKSINMYFIYLHYLCVKHTSLSYSHLRTLAK